MNSLLKLPGKSLLHMALHHFGNRELAYSVRHFHSFIIKADKNFSSSASHSVVCCIMKKKNEGGGNGGLVDKPQRLRERGRDTNGLQSFTGSDKTGSAVGPD